MATDLQISSQTTASFSPELQAFCRRLGILDYVPVAVDLVEKCFSPVLDLGFSGDIDPETGEEWLNVEFKWRGEIHDFLERYNEHTRQWVTMVPWPERDKICLAFQLI